MAIVHLGAKRVQGLKIDRTNDSLGSSANGTNSGITLVNQKLGTGCLSLDGTDDYVELGSAASSFNFFHGTSDWSINFWVQYNEFVAEDRFFNNISSSENNGISIRVGSTGNSKLGLSIKSSNGWLSNQDINFPSTITLGEWVMITVTCDYSDTTNTYKIYVNGSAGGTVGRGSTGSSNNADTTMKLGRRGHNSTKFFDGLIDDVAMWNCYTLTQSEINLLYNSGSGAVATTVSTGGTLYSHYPFDTNADDTQNNNDGTNYGGTIGAIQKLGTGAYSLSGANPVHFPDANNNKLLPATGDFSITCWIYHTGHSDHQQIFRCQDSNGSSEGEFRINSSGTSSQEDRLALSLPIGSNGTVMTTNAVPQNEWVHLAVTRTGATVKLYINGTIETNQNTSGTFNATSAWGDDTPRIGRMENANETLQGKIDDLGVWHRVLTATEIGKLANNNASADMGFYSANANQSCADGKFTFDLQRKAGTDTSSWDLYDDVPTSANETSWTSANTVSDETWTLRGKIRFTSIGDDENWCWIALTRNYYGFTSNDAISSSYGIGVQFRFGTSLNTYYTNDLVANGTSFAGQKGTGDNSQNWTPAENTDYYLEIKRTSTTSYSVSMFENADFSTDPIGTITGTCSNTITKLKYIKVMNTYVNPAGTGSDIEGYVSWWKFYDGTNSPSGTPTKTYEFVDGDAQLVSSLSDKSNLKAHYTMDSTSLGVTELFEVTGSSGTGWDSSGTSINFNSAHSNAIGSTSTSSGDYVTRTISDLTGGATTTLDDEKWVVDFEAYHTGNSNNFNLEFATSTPSYSGSYYALGNFFQDNATTYYWITTDNNNGTRSESYFPSSPSGRLNAYKGEILYGRMTRLAADSFKVEAFTDSGRTNSLGSATRTVNASIAGLDRMNVWANGGGGNYYVKNVKVYNGVTSVDGCKNDFSATTALDGQTNLPVNTIFEQIDDTPSYWFKQSDNSWLWSPVGIKYNLADGNTGWAVQSSSYFYTVGTNELFFKATNVAGDAAYDLGAGNVSDTKWTLRMKVNFSEIGGGNGSNVGFVLSATDEDSGSSTNQNQLGWAWGEPPTDGGTGSGQNYIGIRNTTTASGVNAACYPCRGTAGDAAGFYDDGWDDSATGTDYYIEVKRTSQTDATFTIWTGSYGGTEKVSLSVTNLLDATGLRYIKFMQRQPAESRSGNTWGTIKEMIFYNGVVPP